MSVKIFKIFFLILLSLIIFIYCGETVRNFILNNELMFLTEISKNLLDQQDLMSQVVITGLENQNLSSKIGLVNGEGDLEDISGKSNESGGKIYSE